MLDTHVHFWNFDPVRDAWIDGSMQAIRRDFLPADLEPLLRSHGLTGCVAVQADQSEQETRFLLQLAENHPFVRKVVGWTDLRSPDVEERLAYWAQHGKLAGFRHIVQGEADVNFLLRKDFRRGIAALEPHGYTYDILVYPHQLGAVLEFVRLFPHQPFVIDHLAKPYVKDGFYDGWAALMRLIAKEPHVRCKLSGLVTEADWRGWCYEQFVPYLDLVADSFGPRRLMFGSDWPVCLLAGGYTDALGIVQAYLADFTEGERAAVMGSTGAAFYGIAVP